MGYTVTVQQGNTTWGLVKDYLGKNGSREVSNQDICNAIEKLKNSSVFTSGSPDMIYEGQTLDLSILDENNIPEGNGEDYAQKADEFDAWLKENNDFSGTSAEETFNQYGKSTFSMFDDKDLKNYSKNLLNFSTGLHNKYDTDGDGQLSETEIQNMGFGSMSSIDLDGDGVASNKELAAFLHSADLDVENYTKTGGDVASSIDGNFSFLDIQSRSRINQNNESYQTIRTEQEAFFNNFLKDK